MPHHPRRGAPKEIIAQPRLMRGHNNAIGLRFARMLNDLMRRTPMAHKHPYLAPLTDLMTQCGRRAIRRRHLGLMRHIFRKMRRYGLQNCQSRDLCVAVMRQLSRRLQGKRPLLNLRRINGHKNIRKHCLSPFVPTIRIKPHPPSPRLDLNQPDGATTTPLLLFQNIPGSGAAPQRVGTKNNPAPSQPHDHPLREPLACNTYPAIKATRAESLSWKTSSSSST